MGKCVECSNEIGEIPYNPMPEWKIKGQLCGKCYSDKLGEFYPGDHVRVNRLNKED